MPMKGRPPLEPRIKALEELASRPMTPEIESLVHVLVKAHNDLLNRIVALEARISEMNEAFSQARFPRAPQQSHING